MLSDGDKHVLLIPKRAFASKQKLDEFLDLAYQKILAQRGGELNVTPTVLEQKPVNVLGEIIYNFVAMR